MERRFQCRRRRPRRASIPRWPRPCVTATLSLDCTCRHVTAVHRQRIIHGHRAIHESDREGESRHRDALRARGRVLVFQRLLERGRPAGLMTAQRYPDDYDGIGRAVFRFTNLHMGQLWTSHVTLKYRRRAHARGFHARRRSGCCDAHDGVKDGIITDPSSCSFDPRVPARLPSRADRSAEADLPGAANRVRRQPIYPGLEPGGEGPQPGNPGWGMIMNGTTPFAIDNAVLGAMGLQQPELGLEDVRLRP